MKDENTMILGNTKVRILQYLEYKGISKPQFYTDIDIKRGLLDSDKMNATVTDAVIAKILVVYADIDPLWLLIGEGSMLRHSKNSEEPTMYHGTEKVQSTSSDAVTMRLMDKLDERDRKLDEKDNLLKDKETKIDHLQSELRAKSEELAVLKAQYQHPGEPVIAFTPGSPEAYTESSLPMNQPITPSKKLSDGKI